MTHLAPTLAILALLAAPLAAATYKSATYRAVTQSVAVALKSSGGGARPARQVFVSVTRLDGAPIGRGELARAGDFANRVACGDGTALGTVSAGLRGAAADFEVLCVEG
ncbi:MAG: hypothetical protein EP318_05145 [Rhodobacteraceae bacterium]|nr:MAG: hypothetical protein EP318_05145 [Paracoccaceae bacterium]